MSGIVGSINTRGSGITNLGSATDGQVFTGTGAGLPAGFEAAAGGGGGLASQQVFINPSGTATWTRPSDITLIKVIVTGGGAGGGSGSQNYNSGGAGGAGGTAVEIIDVTSISSVTVTVGAGGAGGAATTYGADGVTGGTSSFLKTPINKT